MAAKKTKPKTAKKTLKKPSAKKPVAKKTAPKKKPIAKQPSAKKPSAKKPSAKKPSAKKPSAKKTAPKKTAPRKAAPKKTAPKKKVAVRALSPSPSPRDVAFKMKTVAELKALLHKNDQIVAGGKKELADRIVDRIEHGNLPRCPQCCLGRLKQRAKGALYCPGGFDDDEYKACDFTAESGSIERPPWQFETPGVL